MLAFVLQSDYWEAALRIAGPIALAALAALICSRAGILFIAVEGVMLIAAFFSVAGTIWTESIWVGVVIGVVAGVVASLLFGVMAMVFRMGDVIGGLVLHVGALGLTGFFSHRWFPGGATIGVARLTGLGEPFKNDLLNLFFHQQPLIYVALAAVVAFEVFLLTKWGLRVRASGESIRVSHAFGIDLLRLRFRILAVAGVLTGLGGATLALAVFGEFAENMVNGRGFIALACVMLGAWRPAGVAAAALLFGAADALQFRLGVTVGQVGGWIKILPYLLAIVAISLGRNRRRGPVEEGRGLEAA